jgi:hypothetical protein
MNALARFISLGMQDADRRVAAALERPPLDPADRYLKTSAVVMAVDRMTRRLSDWWLPSKAGQALSAMQRFAGEPSAARYQRIAFVLLTAAVVHVAVTLINGPRPGWFWMVIPAMATMFAALLLAGSRSSHSTD